MDHTDTQNKDTLHTRKQETRTYLALGDSYTIGEAVAQNQSFPYQLAEKFNAANLKTAGVDLKIGIPEIIARTGWTTGELQSAIQSASITSTYDIVTLLIGVNNQYRGGNIDTYRKEFRHLLESALAFAGGHKNHVFVISIPDWGATSFGQNSGRGPENIGREIDAFNAVNKDETGKMEISYTDITPGSRDAKIDASLVATDGLHPSGKMYGNWVTQLLPAVVKAAEN
ncbi:SGNH/GDSL hydrolase family protein [Pedobacter sp. AW31-3R]|uniref:SGNH/GDSL hydrolase family protein n=1 Tax=Pedobacter sp. AW31-3R TaxID=3445781 RepID=UPI003F9EF87E